MTVKRFSFQDLTTLSSNSGIKKESASPELTLGEHILAELALKPPTENEIKMATEAEAEIVPPVEERADPFQEGFQAGYQQAQQDMGQSEHELMLEQNEYLKLMVEHMALYVKTNPQDILIQHIEHIKHLTLSIAQKLVGYQVDFSDLIEQILVKYSHQLALEQNLILRLNPSLQPVTEKLENYCQKNLPYHVEIKFDPKLKEHECKLEWHDGSLIYDRETIYKQIEEIFLEITSSKLNSDSAI